MQQKDEIEIEGGANIDFINKDTNLVIESVLTKKWWYWENILSRIL